MFPVATNVGEGVGEGEGEGAVAVAVTIGVARSVGNGAELAAQPEEARARNAARLTVAARDAAWRRRARSRTRSAGSVQA
jgi:hypothetical protein